MMRLLLLFALTAPLAAQSCSGISLGFLASMNGFDPSAGDAWHVDVSGMAADPNTSTIFADLGSTHIHADFGTKYGAYGIPYNVVDSTVTPTVPFAINSTGYAAQSDVALTPIPSTLTIESNPAACTATGDNHAIVFDRATCTVTEFYHMKSCPGSSPQYTADASTIWDKTLANQQRPYTFTSVDAAGLSVFSGLVRYDEVATGTVDHAFRITSNVIACDYSSGALHNPFELPAVHSACTQGSQVGGNAPIEGQRWRLKANVDISGYSATNQVILRAMKKYGFILADLGGAGYFQGTPDSRWDTDDIALLGNIQFSQMEVVQQGTIYTDARYPSGAPPTIASFSAAQASLRSGQCTTLNFSVTGASYQYIDQVGFVRSAPTVCPTVTTTYTLTASNHFLVGDDGFGDGTRPTASVTVTVLPGLVPFFNGNVIVGEQQQ